MFVKAKNSINLRNQSFHSRVNFWNRPARKINKWQNAIKLSLVRDTLAVFRFASIRHTGKWVIYLYEEEYVTAETSEIDIRKSRPQLQLHQAKAHRDCGRSCSCGRRTPWGGIARTHPGNYSSPDGKIMKERERAGSFTPHSRCSSG